jgi:predicted unusual protein kinase regulating ubiquinone biosynthesis (AarF/ABC1/UbiB family)
VHVPRVRTDLSTRRVLVSEYVAGERFETVRRADQARRDRYGEIVFRFFFGLLYRDRIALGDPHPGNYLLRGDGRVCFLDFGLLREVSADRVAAEARMALGVRDNDPAQLRDALVAGGYLPEDRAGLVNPELALRMMRRATGWYAVPGVRRVLDERDRGEPGLDGPRPARPRPDADQRAAFKQQVDQFTLPPEVALVRRMHGVVASVLQTLRAEADWGGIAAEYLHGEPPVTSLGQQEADFLASVSHLR